MNTNTTGTNTNAQAPLTGAQVTAVLDPMNALKNADKAPKAPKGKGPVNAPAAPNATENKPEAPKPEEVTPRQALLAKVNAAISDCKGRAPAEQRAILATAFKVVSDSSPEVTFSENKEQRAAQLTALRETRKNLGWQDCAKLLGNAIAAIPGSESVETFAAQPMANGSLRARKLIVTTSKAAKGAGKRAVVIR